MKYTHQDMQELFVFATKNTDKTLEDFFSMRSQTINDREIKMYKDVIYESFKLEDYGATLYIYKDNTQTLYHQIKTKLIGNRNYIDLYSSDCWLFVGAIVVFDESTEEYYPKDVETENFKILWRREGEDGIFDEFYEEKNNLKNTHYSFWSDYGFNLFVKNDMNMSKKFVDLFKKEENIIQ